MARRVLRWTVPVDDHPHPIGNGQVVQVASRTFDGNPVEVWTLETDSATKMRHAQVFGTGQPLPPEANQHLGSVVAAGGALVWHLFATTPRGD